MPAFYYSTTLALEDAEIWYGPHVTRDAAATAAVQRFPDVGFWTAEAVPQTNALDIFEPAMFEPEGCIANVFEDVNAELLGEDGEGGPNHWDTDAVAALVKRLNYQFTAWAHEHGYQRGWSLDVRAEEWTPAPNRSPVGRMRPVLSLAMGGAHASGPVAGDGWGGMKIDTRTMHSARPPISSDSASRLRWFLIGALVGGLLALAAAGRF